MIIHPPKSERELLERAHSLAGLSIRELANRVNVSVPENLRREKGWQGQLLEICLGANAGNKPEPDFVDIGVELKTLPIDVSGKPKETTFVSSIPLLELGRLTWETSVVRKKLSRVLWVPVEATPDIPLPERRVGTALLWSPSEAQEAILRNDWQELTDMMNLGQLESITARHGVYLQVRPKAANAKSLCYGFNQEGKKVLTLPRGFYLRTTFTSQLLAEFY